ncbi:MAG: hypothetical protein HYT65_03040 [Candidatus Yanofskybacteria bacterium]|nr:hypothetical protein [Candidatus Yanofskybacteria bacterium]
MDNIKKGTPRDVFLHLLAVLTLYVSVVAFITLWWQYINVLFPDILKYQDYYSYSGIYDPIRWAMAALIIVFPIHILISWLIGREFKAEPEKREIRVRKWLWYITLFASAATIIIDLITLVYNFLKGELTTQFFLKTIVILIIAGAVFGYYLWDLKKRAKQSNKPKLFAWIASAVVLASIIYGFLLIGTPATQRARRFDEQRVNNLSVLQSEVINYWQQKGELPKSLDVLKNQISGFIPPVDPETGQPYEYLATDPLSFKLCAEFKTSSIATDNMMRSVPMPVGAYYPYQQNWNHGMGRVCFERTIDPQLYKRSDGIPVPLKY